MKSQIVTDHGQFVLQIGDVGPFSFHLHDQGALAVKCRHTAVFDVDLPSGQGLGEIVCDTDPVASQG
jgi:hypothetical protein